MGIPYEIKKYKRLATGQSPPELVEMSATGKSPVIEDGVLKLGESGAIIGEHCLRSANKAFLHIHARIYPFQVWTRKARTARVGQS